MLLERAATAVTRRGTADAVARRRAIERQVPWVAAAVTLLVHLLGNPHYGFFRDELYFIVCGRHPALGYVDQPSLTPLLAALSQIFGTSLFALRVIPAICAAASTYVACLFVAELGGAWFAMTLAGLVTLIAPEMLALGARLSPDTLEVVLWPLLALWLLRLAKGESPRWWLAIGALVGVAGWSKYSIAFFAFGLLIALLLTRQRRLLASGWFAGGVAIAAAIIAPNVWWQWHYQFPMLQLLHNDYDKFMLQWPPFPLQQIMIMSPLLSVVWLIGLVWLLRDARTRFLGYAYLIMIGIMWALDAKNYYPAAVYPYLIAAGAVPIEEWTTGRARAWRGPVLAVVTLLGLPSLPFVLPVLPLRSYVAYQEAFGRAFGIRFHVDKDAGNDTPIQYYADMTGWPEMAAQVAQIYQSLPPAQRARAAIYAHNFGEASALDIYGRDYGLPPALSSNNNFWIWGTRGYTGDVVIDVNGPELLRLGHFRSVRRAGTIRSRFAMPYENNLPVWVASGPRISLPQLWPKLKNYSYAFDGL